MKFGKRELVLSALVVSLGAAVYINWQFNENSDALNADTDNSELGVAQYVNATVSSQSSSSSDSAETSATSKSSSSSTSSAASSSESTSSLSDTEEYFARARLERQQTQDELLELAQDTVEAADGSTTAKAAAVEQLNKLSDIIQQQTNIESLVIAKGFTDCVAFIQDNECSVVVTGQELKSDNLIAIKDIVMAQTGLSFDEISITQI